MATLANGLTDDDQRYCFEMANAIWTEQASATIHNGFGISLTLSQLDVLQNDLMTRLTNLSTTSVAIIQDIIYGTSDGFGWVQVRKGGFQMTNGGSDTVNGVTMSQEEQRQSLQKLFDGYVGCLHMARAVARSQDQERKQSTVIGIARG